MNHYRDPQPQRLVPLKVNQFVVTLSPWGIIRAILMILGAMVVFFMIVG